MKKFLSVVLIVTLLLFSAVAMIGCNKDDEKTITVGASSTPHAEILEYAKPLLEARGYTLKIVVYNDYVLPNKALADGTLDANYFQHTPFLNSFNKANGTNLVAATAVHYEPFGIYGNGIGSLKDLPDGATIIIPADDTNCTRALFLLAQEHLITLKDDASAESGVTVLDIASDNGYNIVTVEAEAAPGQLKNADVGTIAVINGNYALSSGLSLQNALATEAADGITAQTYANVIAVRSGDENKDKIKALVEVLNSDEVKNYIDSTYNGAVKTVGK